MQTRQQDDRTWRALRCRGASDVETINWVTESMAAEVEEQDGLAFATCKEGSVESALRTAKDDSETPVSNATSRRQAALPVPNLATRADSK